MNPTILGRGPARKRGRNRNLTPGRLRTGNPAPVNLSAAEIGPTDVALMLTFDTNVVLSGVPKVQLADGRVPASATLISPQVIVLTYEGLALEAQSFTIAFDDHAVRGYTGGYLVPGSYQTGFTAAFQARTFTAEPVEAKKKKAA